MHARESDFRRFREPRSWRITRIIGFLLVACRALRAPAERLFSPHDRTIAAFPDIVCALPSVTDGRPIAVGRCSSAKRPRERERFTVRSSCCAAPIISQFHNSLNRPADIDAIRRHSCAKPRRLNRTPPSPHTHTHARVHACISEIINLGSP